MYISDIKKTNEAMILTHHVSPDKYNDLCSIIGSVNYSEILDKVCPGKLS